MTDPDKKEIDIQKAIQKTEFFLQDFVLEQAENYETDPEIIDSIAMILDNSDYSERHNKWEKRLRILIIDKYEAEVVRRYLGK